MPPASRHGSYADAVSGWAAHLRSGGTTPWADWLAGADTGPPTAGSSAPAGQPLPDAIHLEVLRRLNLAAGRPLGGLADRVLVTGSPGRGRVDVPLPWPGAVPAHGTPPTDPADLPAEELIRLAVGVLVHLLPDVPPPGEPARPRGLPVPWRHRFLLHGAPRTAAAVRARLLAEGLVESEWRPVHVVLARPVDELMAEHWAASTRAGGILKWATLWRRAMASGRLPETVDVASTAASLAGRRHEPVHVVLARDARGVSDGVAAVLGVRRPPVSEPSDEAATLVDPVAADVLRRANRLTALTAGADRVRDLASRLAGLLDTTDHPAGTPSLRPPPFARQWAVEQAAGTARALTGAGYAVHGDPDALLPAGDGPGTVDRTHTLELALAACLDAWRRQEGAS